MERSDSCTKEKDCKTYFCILLKWNNLCHFFLEIAFNPIINLVIIIFFHVKPQETRKAHVSSTDFLCIKREQKRKCHFLNMCYSCLFVCLFVCSFVFTYFYIRVCLVFFIQYCSIEISLFLPGCYSHYPVSHKL